MRFDMPMPPTVSGENPRESLENTLSWLTSLCENLNMVLNSIGEENFSPDMKELIKSLTERTENSEL